MTKTTDEVREARELFYKVKKFLDKNETEDMTQELIDNLSVEYVENKKVYRGFYLNSELTDILDKISTKKNRGFKSDIINIALKEFLIKEGLYPLNK